MMKNKTLPKASDAPMISVVVPCYKDEDNIRPLFARLSATMTKIALPYEIIYINDASPDGAAGILDRLANEYEEVTVITHSRNFGKMAVYDTGMRHAIGDVVIVMDGDLQDPPELIEQFIEKWREGFLVVYGRSQVRHGLSSFQRISTSLFYRLWSKLLEFQVPKFAGDFCLLDRRVVEILNALPEKERFFRGLRAWVGFPQTGVDFERPPRHIGLSTQSSLSYFSWAKFAIFSFSRFPLRFISVAAFISVILLVLYFIVILVLFILGVRGPLGFMTLLTLLIFSSAVILTSLSIMAEYLIQIFGEVKQRPVSIIQSIQNDHHSE